MTTKPKQITLSQSFGKALSCVRKHRGLTQEDFTPSSGRTYISELERGLKSPTLDKVQELSEVLSINPATLIYLALYFDSGEPDLESVAEAALQEMREILDL